MAAVVYCYVQPGGGAIANLYTAVRVVHEKDSENDARLKIPGALDALAYGLKGHYRIRHWTFWAEGRQTASS